MLRRTTTYVNLQYHEPTRVIVVESVSAALAEGKTVEQLCNEVPLRINVGGYLHSFESITIEEVTE